MGKNNKADKGHDVKKAEMAAAARSKKDHRSPDKKAGEDALARFRQIEIDTAKAAKKAQDAAFKASCEELQSFIDEKGALTVEDAPLLAEALREHLDFQPNDFELSEAAREVLRPLVARVLARMVGVRAKQEAAVKADLERKQIAAQARAERAKNDAIIAGRADVRAMEQLEEALQSMGVDSLIFAGV